MNVWFCRPIKLTDKTFFSLLSIHIPQGNRAMVLFEFVDFFQFGDARLLTQLAIVPRNSASSAIG